MPASTQSTSRAKSAQGFDLFHNASGVNAEVRQQFRRLAGTRQRRHRELVDFDSVHAEFARDRVTQTTFKVMVFDGDNGTVRFLRGSLDDIQRAA